MTIRPIPLVLVAVVMAGCAVSTAYADIQFSIRDGRVVLVATDASIADIMAEWAKIGRTKIVNADKLPKDVVTLELRNVSERQVLDILLRTTSGFIAALRDVGDPSASLFDRIIIMPPSAPPPPTLNASTGPQNRRAPAPAMPVQEPPPPQLEAAAAEQPIPPDDPPPVMVGAATPEPPEAFTTNSRHMMETVDPRNFRLPPGAMNIGAGVALPPVVTSSRPGVIVTPTPNSP